MEAEDKRQVCSGEVLIFSKIGFRIRKRAAKEDLIAKESCRKIELE